MSVRKKDRVKVNSQLKEVWRCFKKNIVLPGCS